MYTQIHFASDLKKETPKEVIDILKAMDNGTAFELYEKQLPNHDFFKCGHWAYLFTMGSAYFDYDTTHHFGKQEWSDTYNLSVTSNLKNYSDEIDLFIDWITPYLDKQDGDFLGYSRYEETEIPTLIYHPNKLFTPDVPKEITN